jgi:dUTP pyrophosphatase
MNACKPILKFKLLDKIAKLPSYAHTGDAGFDLYSSVEIVVPAGGYVDVPLKITAEIPEGFYVQFFGKSGLALKFGIDTLGGVIDSGYRGEWTVILANHGKIDYQIAVGDKVAQGILIETDQAEIVEVGELSKTERGSRAFGSTGRK